MNDVTCLLSMIILVGAFCLFACIGETVVDILYNNVPSYRKWYNKKVCGGIDYEEEDKYEDYR